MNDVASEMNFDELRNLTPAERRRRFLAYKEAREACAHHESRVLSETIRWYSIDDPILPEQIDELPPPRSDDDSRTNPIWVKYRHPRRKVVIVAKGWFDYDCGSWRARIDSVEESDYIGEVTPLAWAHIIPGLRPWNGPTVPYHIDDPW
jgi:hypothetical protein